ncbi:MAG: ATP-binding protein [Anaerolineae bacterium]|nr:ATP-binding protein [Anaerolineae bacterium]
MRHLPIGIQTFSHIIQGDFLYVDKTHWVYKLIQAPKGVYFLARPRRFGKSLLLSTLEAVFTGQKALFKGLWIDECDYNWSVHPVVRIDFSLFRVDNAEELKQKLTERLTEIAVDQGVVLGAGDYQKKFRDLLRALSSRNPVVVLIDEYDKPIIDNIDNSEEAVRIRDVLKSFYGVLKGMDAYLRFVLLTGVSKFSKVGVFSGMNNLQDITFDDRFAALPGITQEEVINFFSEYIQAAANHLNLSRSELLSEVKRWYNGFCFSKQCLPVYNPFSLLLFFDTRDFRNYWFETGTPTFLIELLKNRNYDVRALENLRIDELAFSSYEVENLRPVPLLFQTGYLTIKHYDPVSHLYTLSYPNYEVQNAFLRYLLGAFSPVDNGVAGGYLWRLVDALRVQDWELFFETLHIFFAGIPYDIQIPRERYYQTIFYLIFRILGLQVDAEVRTNRGRIDAVIKLQEGIFVFEFKLEGTVVEALEQIAERGYAAPYLQQGKPVYAIGVVFGIEERGIVDWKVTQV